VEKTVVVLVAVVAVVSGDLQQGAKNDSIILLASASIIGVGENNNLLYLIDYRSRAIV